MDGPMVWTAYDFGGTPNQWKQHHRSQMTAAGWTEIPVGNLPGQLINFEKQSGAEHGPAVLRTSRSPESPPWSSVVGGPAVVAA